VICCRNSRFTSALVYCALSLFSTHQNVSSSLYVSTLINGAIEIPVNAAAIWIIDWKPLGRRRTGCISLVGAGVSSFACAISILYGACYFTTIHMKSRDIPRNNSLCTDRDLKFTIIDQITLLAPCVSRSQCFDNLVDLERAIAQLQSIYRWSNVFTQPSRY